MRRRRTFVAGLSAAAMSFRADAQRRDWIDIESRQQLRGLQMSLTKRYRIPASVVAIIKDGELVDSLIASQTLGELPPSLNLDTYFQVASISKVVNAIVVLRLAEQRKLSLDAPVNTMLRSWQLTGVSQPYVDAVTPRLLLCDRGGTNVPGFPGYLSGAPLPTLVEILNGAPPATRSTLVRADKFRIADHVSHQDRSKAALGHSGSPALRRPSAYFSRNSVFW
jgi:CubicO group peptidase (beta-lactamase class C family)